MKICVALLLLAACSAEPRAATDANRVVPIAAEPLAPASQTAAAQSRPAADSAAANIMTGEKRPDGSFIHGDHIHLAGQENCPSEMSGGPVQ